MNVWYDINCQRNPLLTTVTILAGCELRRELEQPGMPERSKSVLHLGQFPVQRSSVSFLN